MAQRPNKNFCALAGIPHPAPEELWHPREFTLERLSEILATYGDKGYMFTTFANFIGSTGAKNDDKDHKFSTVAVPVCFSPSQALEMADAITRASGKMKIYQHMRGTFFFEANSPSYKLDDPRTKSAMAQLVNNGHQVGIMLGVEPGMTKEVAENTITDTMRKVMSATGQAVAGITYRSVGTSAATVFALQEQIMPLLGRLSLPSTHARFGEQVGVSTSSNGIYKNGHPLSIIENGKAHALLNFVECWHSREPLWALDRLGSLPEVDANVPAVTEQYLDRVKVPVLGATNTREVVPEFEHWRGRAGFREGMKLQASG